MIKLSNYIGLVLVLGCAAACKGTNEPEAGATGLGESDAKAPTVPTGDINAEPSAPLPSATSPVTTTLGAAGSPNTAESAPNASASASTNSTSSNHTDVDDIEAPQASGDASSSEPSSSASSSGEPSDVDASATRVVHEAGTATPIEAAAPPTRDPRPGLVISGQDAWWVTTAPSEAPSDAAADVVVEADTRLQTWDGFGGSFEEWGWEALQRLEPSEQERAMRLLFDLNEGAHFTWGRLPIGASAYAVDRYSLNDVDGDEALEHFSIERDELRLLPYLRAALAVNPDLRLLAAPWSPPAWMKANGEMDQGSIRNEAPILQSYALYLARYVEAYEEAGFDIEAVHIQNDITWVEDSPSCEWSAATLTSFVKDFLGPTFLARDVSAELWLGEFGILNEASILEQVMADPSAAAFIAGVSLSWDTWSLAPALQDDYALPVMQTRHEPGNSPWLTGFAPDDAPNDFAYGVQTWDLLYKWIDSGVNAYMAWNMVLDEHDEGLNEVQVWPKNTLLRVDPETSSLVETPAYYVFRHLSYFVDPGAVRLATVAPGAQTLAFENPDGSIAVAVHNRDAEQVTLTVSVAGRKPRFEVPGHGWATLLIE